MKTIEIRTQKELDDLPKSFKEFTVIKIVSSETIAIVKAYRNASVRACNNASVRAYGNASVTAYDDVSVEAYDDASITAYDDASITAYDDASITAYGNASVRASGNASVRAYRNASVRAYGNASITAYDDVSITASGNASITASGNASITAYDDASITASGNASITAYDDVSVRAYRNASVRAYDDASITAYDDASVEAFLCATVFIHSIHATVKKLLDNSHLVYKIKDGKGPGLKDASAKITEYEDLITPTFEQWLERGYVYADGIHKKYVSHKTIGNVTVYEVTDFFGKEKSFVARSGDKFAHGKTIEEATNDLRYKISDRDTSEFESWTLETIATQDKMIEAYRKITGACGAGVKDFVESIELKNELSVKEVVELTKDKFGHEEFREFFV